MTGYDAPSPARPGGRGARARSSGEVLARLAHLLAEEAPAEELDTLEIEARAAATASDRALLLRAIGHARHVHDMLVRRKRREHEAQALYETARDLTSLRDVDDVLTAIVDRVRRLLATDSTYIALIDEQADEAYMRVTSGTTSPAIRSVRQPPGWGIGGRVIQTGQPFATANYLADPTIHRDPSVTSAVSADGIVSIAGVPMRLGHRVIGALFAADRHERTFEQSEIALLSSLADHASIVLENARLFDQARTTAHELREVHAQLSTQRRALEQADAAHELLMPLALTQADLDDFATALARTLDGTVVLVSNDSHVLAASAASEGITPEALLAPVPEDASGATARPESGTAAVLLRAGGETCGRLLFGRRRPLLDGDVRILERGAETATLLLLMQRQTSIVADELRRELVEDLLAAQEPDWTSFQQRADRCGALSADEPHAIVVLSAAELPRRRLLEAAGEVAAARNGLAGEHSEHVVLLLPGSETSSIARGVAAELTRTLGAAVTAGAAGPARGGRALRAQYRGAARCHQLLVALGREGQGAGLDELGVVGAVLENVTPEQVSRVVTRTLGPLRDYDAEHGTSLLATVECYFDRGQSPPATARALGVHVNTMYQRIDRIDQVLGSRSWREPHGAVDVQMALRLHRLMGGGEDAAGATSG